MNRLTTSEKIAILRGIPLFSTLSESALDELLRICLNRDYPAGSYVVQQSQVIDSFYVILRGKVKIYKVSSHGDEQILHMYGPGHVFAEAAMFSGIKIPARVVTLTDTMLLVVRRGALKLLLEKNPEMAMAMMGGMAAKLREFNQLISQLSLRDVTARLGVVILQQAARADSDTFKLSQSKRHLAGQIGTVPETLSRSLKKLKDIGVIDVNGPTITVLNRTALENLVE